MIRNPLALGCIAHVSGGGHRQIVTVFGKTSDEAWPAGVWETCEQRDNRPTLTDSKLRSPTVWKGNADRFLLKTQTSAFTRKWQQAHRLGLPLCERGRVSLRRLRLTVAFVTPKFCLTEREKRKKMKSDVCRAVVVAMRRWSVPVNSRP